MPSDETSGNAPADELDDLFNYDVDPDDPFRPSDTTLQTAAASKQPQDAPKADLGIDEEIKPIRRRTPIPKLDQDRLLSQNGIPKLRKITKTRLKLKGKGHEFSDVARLLALYQLWLDDLYPRAKFADGLAIIEKLGHSKGMQKKRKDWIHETKSRTIGHDEAEIRDQPHGSRMSPPKTIDGRNPDQSSTVNQDHGHGGQLPDGNTAEEAMFMSDDGRGLGEADPSEDELDQLLAEDAVRERAEPEPNTGQSARSQPLANAEDDFAAEMEVMAEMGW